MADQTASDQAAQANAETPIAEAKSTTKKTTKKATKAAAKATTKKASKASAKAVTKKAAAKATAKKTTKKTTRKKTATAKPNAESDAALEDIADADGAETSPDSVSEAAAETPAKKPARKKTTRKAPAKTSAAKAGSEDLAESEADGADDFHDTTDRALELDDAPADRDPVAEAPSEMIINYTPGEECRIAIIEDGKLEEFDSEPTENVSRVGNIYRGKVVNIERNIQAAFVDFGTDNAGFLHLSDLHPRYFPGADADETEKVGRKTPRRQRPPIEQALKKGQEITVQVLKEGVGTKGPTLTSYLSIPGRFLVMMPDMDKVGVSRKVEDEDLRRKMRKILDQLDLPSGFGFILRTAGLERTKEDLKRDLDYLQRLWHDMERRQNKGRGPALLYSESDLLLRTLRDRVTNQVKRIVIDNKAALARAAGFMKIVAPRATTKLCHFDENRPIFHAFGIEEQLDLMHATEVPLPSGGALVIEQTEALVAIDVNSGRSRGARDAEANAYNTNLEAVDEICRQLRLRDQGGLVICDLIDMRHASNRKDIENRFTDRLKRDRARSTILPISQFGILEMTRQRMRGSYEQQHYHTCPRCTGRGLIQRPDSIAATALRDLTALLEHERVHRVELVVSTVVAGALLSTRRGTLGRIERLSGKRIDVHVKETLAAGRVVMYAYDQNGADIDIERLPKRGSKPKIIEWANTDLAKSAGADDWAIDLDQEAADTKSELETEITEHEEAEAEKIAALDLPPPVRKASARSSGRSDAKPKSQAKTPTKPEPTAGPATTADTTSAEDDDSESGGKKKRRRRRRRRGSKSGEEGGDQSNDQNANDSNEQSSKAPASDNAHSDNNASDNTASDSTEGEQRDNTDEHDSESGGKKKRRRRRRRRGGKSADDNGETSENNSAQSANGQAPKPDSKPAQAATPEAEAKPAKPRRRSLYGSGRRTLSASEKANVERD